MTRKLVIILIVALAIPAAALANSSSKAHSVGNAKLAVAGPKTVDGYWVGSAALKAPSAESLQLQVCIQLSGKTDHASCTYVHGSHVDALAAATKKTHGSGARTWAWADVDGHAGTVVS